MKHRRKVHKYSKERAKELQKRVEELEKENRILRWNNSDFNSLKRRIRILRGTAHLSSYDLLLSNPDEFVERQLINDLVEKLYSNRMMKITKYGDGLDGVIIIEGEVAIIDPKQ